MLDEIVENVYRAFAAYPAPEHETYSGPLCRNPETQIRLKAMSVREIPDELLFQYHLAADVTAAPVDEIKHFLPRYLDIVSRFQFDHFWVETALDRLTAANDAWTEEEQSLLVEWAQAYFKQCLASYPDSKQGRPRCVIENIVDILIMLARGHFDVKPLLESWAGEGSLAALLHYKDLVLWGFNKNMTRLENSFADGDDALFETLIGWVKRPDVVVHFYAGCKKAIASKASLLDANNRANDKAHRDDLKLLRTRLGKWRKSGRS